MEDQKKIVWLASYPKSGNTWFRVFLTNLLNKNDRPADINNLYATPIASNREIFDEATGINSSDLSPAEIDNLRPDVYRFAAHKTEELLFQKVHDAWVRNENGIPIFPEDITYRAVYFIRNPLDVATSFANHLGRSLDDTIQVMNREDFAFANSHDGMTLQLRQRLLTWSNHVKSWVDQSALPILVIRYEDMKSDTFNTFKKAIEFIGIQASEAELNRAIEFSDIKEMQRQEAVSGFKEKPAICQSFFRKGEIGSWKAEMTLEQINRIQLDHREVMMRFGYYP